MFDPKSAWDSASSAIGSAFGSLTPGKEGENSLSSAYSKNISETGLGPESWHINPQDWYKIKGFEFAVYFSPWEYASAEQLVKESNSYRSLISYNFVLPIPPQTLIVKPISASNATATMGGVVEEVSPVKFWTIAMTGTTGIAVGRKDGDISNRDQMAANFRSVLSTSGLFDGTLGSVQQSLGKIGNVLNQGADAFNAFASGDIRGGFGAAAGTINTALTPSLPYSSSAINGETNGFLEAQELQKFFYMYDALKSKDPKQYILRFTNRKSNQSWRCQVKDFALQQSASNPYLFRYTINLQCWDILSADKLRSSGPESYDRFGPNGDLAGVNTATSAAASEALDGVF